MHHLTTDVQFAMRNTSRPNEPILNGRTVSYRGGRKLYTGVLRVTFSCVSVLQTVTASMHTTAKYSIGASKMTTTIIYCVVV